MWLVQPAEVEGAGAAAVNQKASGSMGLIRDPGEEIKEGSSKRLNCICHNCREQLIQSRPRGTGAIKKKKKPSGRRREGEEGQLPLETSETYFQRSRAQKHVLDQLAGVLVWEDELALSSYLALLVAVDTLRPILTVWRRITVT